MSGKCCPGLRALTSAAPMESYEPDAVGTMCFANCWQLHCTPCGDGACQEHLGENYCGCPEDCPQPPYPLVCTPNVPESCGRKFCRQEGTVCHQETPSCVANLCERDVQDLANHVCDPTKGTCTPG